MNDLFEEPLLVENQADAIDTEKNIIRAALALEFHPVFMRRWHDGDTILDKDLRAVLAEACGVSLENFQPVARSLDFLRCWLIDRAERAHFADVTFYEKDANGRTIERCSEFFFCRQHERAAFVEDARKECAEFALALAHWHQIDPNKPK